MAALCNRAGHYIFALWFLLLLRSEKKLVKQQCLPTCSHNILNFGPLAAEINWLVWGTPAHFNGFRVLGALLHGALVVGVSQLCGVEQRAPLIFDMSAITLGICPRSSFTFFLIFLFIFGSLR